MSCYHLVKTVFKDQECLVNALKEVKVGCEAVEVEVHSTPQQLFDYQGRPTRYTNANGDKANIIVRRQHVRGAANDVGFSLNADGTYSAVLSEYDQRTACTPSWVLALTNKYNRLVVAKAMKAAGFVGATKKVNGSKTAVNYLKVGGR